MKTKKKVKPLVIVGYADLKDFKEKWDRADQSTIGSTKFINTLMTTKKISDTVKVRITIEVLSGN